MLASLIIASISGVLFLYWLRCTYRMLVRERSHSGPRGPKRWLDRWLNMMLLTSLTRPFVFRNALTQ